MNRKKFQGPSSGGCKRVLAAFTFPTVPYNLGCKSTAPDSDLAADHRRLPRQRLPLSRSSPRQFRSHRRQTVRWRHPGLRVDAPRATASEHSAGAPVPITDAKHLVKR